MKGRLKRMVFILVGVFVLACLSAMLWRPSEPVYQGRTLKAWLAELDAKSSQRRDGARAALREIGSNAVPTLLTIMRSKDSSLKRTLAEWVNRQGAIPFRITTDVQWKLRAWAGIEIISAAAIPRLAEYLNHGESVNEAAELLHFAAKQAPEPAVQALGIALSNSDSSVRLAAARALAAIQSDVLQARNVGARALDSPDARAAIPALVKAAGDPNIEVSNAVAWALFAIDPKILIEAQPNVEASNAMARALQHINWEPTAKASRR